MSSLLLQKRFWYPTCDGQRIFRNITKWEGSVKRPEMQEIIQVNLTVRKKGRITLPAYNNYYYMDVHFSAKLFPTRKNKWSLPSSQNSLKILTKRFARNIYFPYLSKFCDLSTALCWLVVKTISDINFVSKQDKQLPIKWWCNNSWVIITFTNVHFLISLTPHSGHFPKVRTGWLDHGWTGHFDNEIGFYQEFLLKNHFLHVCYLG